MQFAEARIVLVTSTWAFTRARRAYDRCGDVSAIREIEAALAHEEWHLRHRPDAQGVYYAQLTALNPVGADPGHPAQQVVRSQLAVRGASTR